MKKKQLVLAIVFLLAILVIPVPGSPYRDGGTRTYTALTYRIVEWNRLTDDGSYEAVRVYGFPDNFRPIDDLWLLEAPKVVHRFTATVLEIDDKSVLVEPVEGEAERSSCDQFRISLAELGDIGAKACSVVDIWYAGGIMESYPAQVSAVKWDISGNLRHKTYEEQWLDEATAESYGDGGDHFVITEIYANCFFASSVIPMPYRFKLNGRLPEDWCVGDQVYCDYENARYDAGSSRMEADFLTVEPSAFELEPGMAYKPVIYLYPETETCVHVELALDGALTCTYPAYNGGWQVTAAPDGTLTDARGQTYNYLYWEGRTNARWDLSAGFCVRGADTAAFLEDALAKLGLTRREANEFIVYWLPLMEGNPWNIISFQADLYENAAKLTVTPEPDTQIRVFMAWQQSDTYAELKPQTLTGPERSGFTVVEWGGAEVIE